MHWCQPQSRLDVSSEQEPTATDGHVCNLVQILREWLSMRLLLVYSDWGEMDMGWGQGHVPALYRRDCEQQEFSEVGAGEKAQVSCRVSTTTPNQMFPSHSVAGGKPQWRGEEPCLPWHRAELEAFGAWVLMWFLSCILFSLDHKFNRR